MPIAKKKPAKAKAARAKTRSEAQDASEARWPPAEDWPIISATAGLQKGPSREWRPFRLR